jgi:DNA repair photolyase
VTRDLDLLRELARHRAAAVFLSITTLDVELARALEPRASSPERRLGALRELASAGVPCGVFVAPIIPALNDHEVPAILQAAREAGASAASYTVVRLPWGVEEQFEAWLREHRPERAERVLNRLRSLRSGKLSDSRFGRRMRGTGLFAEQIAALFRSAARRHGLDGSSLELSSESFRAPGGRQLGLFP